MKTALFIPFFNESNRLVENKYSNFFTNLNIYFIDFFLIDDGSNDNTLNDLNSLKSKFPFLHIISLEKNIGKGEALRQSICKYKNDYDYFAFLDADLSTTLEEMIKMIDFAKDNKYEFVWGSRIKRIGSNIVRQNKRHILGRIVATAIDNLLKIGVYDTQCGAKIFSKEIIEISFNEFFSSRWLFDVDIFSRILLTKGYRYFKNKSFEYPLKYWEDFGNSKITFKDSLKIPIELTKLYIKYNKSLKKERKKL